LNILEITPVNPHRAFERPAMVYITIGYSSFWLS
jgi:hypothetical protein